MRTARCLLVLLAACGSGSESPADKCDDFVTDLCDRYVECLPGQGTHDDCVQTVDQNVPCGKATSVASSYDRCLDEVHSNSCAVLFPTDSSGQQKLALPADCKSVIVVSSRTASPAPASLSTSALAAE